eukprot:jgi/Botrbrau1/14477/Bobra.0014s0113.2
MWVAEESLPLRIRRQGGSVPEMPSSRSDPSREQSPTATQAFLKLQREHGVSLGIVHFAALSGLTFLVYFILSPGGSKEWKVPCAYIGACLLVSVVLYQYPDVASKHIQAINGIVRILSVMVSLYQRPVLLRTRDQVPLNALIFLQIYLLHPLGLASTFIKVGAWQSFLPNLATSALLLCIQASVNQKYCDALGPARTLDVVPLSALSSGLDALTCAAFAPGITPWNVTAEPSCARNIAAFQLLGSFLTDASLLLFEAVQRRSFLVKNAAKLGPGGAARAAAWPLGDLQLATRCVVVAFSFVPGMCIMWQILLIFFV